MNIKYKIILAMLVLAIFTVGCVSAEENVTVDMDVPTEETVVDDAVVLTAEIDEDTSDDADVADEPENLRSQVIHLNPDTPDIQGVINNTESGSTIYFDNGTYDDVALTLKSNINYVGLNATLVGTGTTHVLTIANCENFTISGFNIDVNNRAPNMAAIRGNYVENAAIYGNTIHNGYSAINIFKHYNNVTVRDNIIENMTYDAISFANPMTLPENALVNLTNTNIYNNRVKNVGYGIFIGGNFKGNIYNNTLLDCNHGIQFLGKPDGKIGNIIGNVTNNDISGSGSYGIEFINETIVDLTLNSNNIANKANGIYMTNTTVNDLSLVSNTFSSLTTGINMVNATVNGLTLTSNDLSGMGTGIDIHDSTISGTTINLNTFSGMSTGINIVDATLNGLTIDSNNITYVGMGIGMDDTIIADLTIVSNSIITNHFSDHYAIWNGENVVRTDDGYLDILENYLYGCINHTLEIIATNFEDNTGQVIVY